MFKMLVMTLSILVASQTSVLASASCFSKEKIKEAIESLNDYYGDVPASFSCKKEKKNKVEKMICENDFLQLMDELDTKAYVYAVENATRSEVDHKNFVDQEWIDNSRNKCTSVLCLCQAFMMHTNDSKGGTSPYYYFLNPSMK